MSIMVDPHTKTIEIREKTVLYDGLREKAQASIQKGEDDQDDQG